MIIKPIALYFTLFEKKKEREIKQIPYVVVAVPLVYMKVPDTNETLNLTNQREFSI